MTKPSVKKYKRYHLVRKNLAPISYEISSSDGSPRSSMLEGDESHWLASYSNATKDRDNMVDMVHKALDIAKSKIGFWERTRDGLVMLLCDLEK